MEFFSLTGYPGNLPVEYTKNANAYYDTIVSDKYYTVTNFNTISSSYSTCASQVILTMGMLLTAMNTTLCFRGDTYKPLTSSIEAMSEAQELPEIMTRAIPNGEYKLHLIEIPTNSIKLFAHLSKIKKDNKVLGSALQESASHRVRVYIDEEQKTVRILSSHLSSLLIRRVIALLPLIFKWTIPMDVTNMLAAFSSDKEESVPTWMEYVRTFIKSLKLEDAARKRTLENWAQNCSTRVTVQIKDSIRAYEREITSYENSLAEKYKTLFELQKKLTSYTLTPKEEEQMKELIDYLMKHRAIQAIEQYGSYGLSFLIETPLIYYDETAAKTIINKTADLTDYDTHRTLLKQIFIEQKYLLWTSTAVFFNPSGSSDALFGRHSDRNGDNTELLPQPHIVHNNCWGNNKPLITKSIQKNDFLQAIEQMVAATKNINWFDSLITGKMIRDVRSSNYSTRPTLQVAETGEFITIKDACDLIVAEIAKAKADAEAKAKARAKAKAEAEAVATVEPEPEPEQAQTPINNDGEVIL